MIIVCYFYPGNSYFQKISRQLLLSPLLLPVFRLEHQRLYRHGGWEGGNVRGGEGEEQGGPGSQHPDGLHLGQSPGSPGLGGGGGVGAGVERPHLLAGLELEQRLRPSHLQAGLRGGRDLAGEGERQRLLGGRARSLPQHWLQLQPAELAGVRSGAGDCPHSASSSSAIVKDKINISTARGRRFMFRAFCAIFV